MPDAAGRAVDPLGALLTAGGVSSLKDAEVPREGVTVRRQPSMTRRRQLSALDDPPCRRRGEGASRLAFDSATPRKPRPNAPG